MNNLVKDRLIKLRKRLQFARYCFPKGDDDRFVQNVKAIGQIPELVSLERQDGGRSGDMIYHIYMEESYSGFFADYNKLLEYLYFADYYHLNPVIEYTDKFCYAEQHPVNGACNPFEYYFRQPCGMDMSGLQNAGTVIRSRKENIMLAKRLSEKEEGYTKTEEYLRQMGKMVAKYIKLQPQAEDFVRGSEEQLFRTKKSGWKMVGVHARGTDFKRNYNGHPVAVTLQEYVDETARMMETGQYQCIFLATDDVQAITLFEKSFGKKVFYYKDVIRSDGDETVMKSKAERENHHYKLGLEVLRDMITLSVCDGFVAGLSQVSFATRIQKYSMGQEFEDLRILDKGINYHRAVNCPR